MTQNLTSRPASLLLAVALMTTTWMATLSQPAAIEAAPSSAQLAHAAPRTAAQPVLM